MVPDHSGAARASGSDAGESPPARTPRHEAWHTRAAADVLAELNGSESGLSDADAARRLAEHGPNRFARTRPVPAWRILLAQLTSVVVWLLGAAAVVSLLLGDRVEALAIAAVLALNTAIGFVTEWRARRAMEALLRYEVPKATVVRGGQVRSVDAQTLVPGDVVELGEGEAVPADARLISEADLRTIEAALTGESLPVSKRADATLDEAAPLAERLNMVYTGTQVAAGTARAVVIATGPATELGRIGELVSSVEEERTPLERRLDVLGRRLVWLALGVAALVAGLEFWQGLPLGLVIETGIALAVAAVPEALPAVATIALAVGLRRMARRNALVRRLPSVETLGSTTIVCTDKTGTLTSGDMSVVRVWTGGTEFELPVAGADGPAPALRRALEVAALASAPSTEPRAASDEVPRDPADAAALAAASAAGIDPRDLASRRRRLGLVPFSSERQLMAAFHEADGRTTAYVKGAPHRLIELSDRVARSDGEDAPLDGATRQTLSGLNASMAGQGLRVLALASGPVSGTDERALEKLAFVGFLGLMDPPAEGVKETIGRLREAGLRTVMITGDQRRTAEAVSAALGLSSTDRAVIEGHELEQMAVDELKRRLPAASAFSRVTPRHKLTIVTALQEQGEIVAMLGDGVNDAAALKKADVGVAMGRRGTDVAKEAADIVLQDDRFATVAAAVEEGRVIYDNIRKFVFYLFSCNLAEVMVLFLAGLAGLPPPLRPLQILWLNLVTDTFPALALAVEPGDAAVMRRPPRDPDESLLSRRFLSSIAGYGALITVATLAAYLWGLQQAPAQAQTMAFMTLALAQIFHLGNARSGEPVLRPSRALSNPYAIAAIVAAIGLQIATVEVEPLRTLLGLAGLGRPEWAIVFGLGAAPAIVGQAVKILGRQRRGRPTGDERGRDL